MSKGSPDYVRKAKLYAMYNDTLVPVTVDSAGRIIMMPYGTTTVDGEIDVNQTDAAREVQGADGATLRTIAVDSAGRIIGVFKGDYLGTLKTIKVDEDGRMIALITDELDIYGNKVIVGNAELAVRLGSEKFFDRRGDVFLIDNFKNGIAKWHITENGTGADVSLTTNRVRTGGYAVKITGGSDGLQSAIFDYLFPYPVLSKWGFEVHFAYGSDFDYINFWIWKYTGTQKSEAYIRFDKLNSKLQYVDENYAYQDIADPFTITESSYLFNAVKFVIDLVNDKYHRLIFNENTYDLSAYDIRTTSSSVRSRIQLGITLWSRSGENDYAYIDNVIITQNEPD